MGTIIFAAIKLHKAGLQPDRAAPGVAKATGAAEDLLVKVGQESYDAGGHMG